MTQFRYRAIDPKGQAIEGVVEGNSMHQVTRKLQERGLTVNQVLEPEGEALFNVRPAHLPWQELLLVAQQLDMIARNDYPLAPSLKTMGRELGSKRLKSVLAQVGEDLEQGHDLNEALERRGNQFPALFIHLVRAGEAANNLSEVTRLLINYCARRVETTARIRTALIYPSILFGAMVILVVIFGLFVVPGMTELIKDFEITEEQEFNYRFIKNLLMLQFLVDGPYGPLGIYGPLIVCALAYISILLIRRYPAGRLWLDWLKMRIPFHGPIHYCATLTIFTQALAMLFKARVPIVESLEIAAACASSPQLERAVAQIVLEIAEGNTLADSCENTNFFTRDYCWLLGVSEKRGDLETTLGHIADSLERDLKARDMTFAALLSPVLVSILGLMVLFLFISMYVSLNYSFI